MKQILLTDGLLSEQFKYTFFIWEKQNRHPQRMPAVEILWWRRFAPSAQFCKYNEI